MQVRRSAGLPAFHQGRRQLARSKQKTAGH